MARKTLVPAILLVEDQTDDIILTQLALKSAGLANPLIPVYNGCDAIAYLTGDCPYENRQTYPIPALILLDLKMPRLDGFGVLEWLKEHTQFDNIAVVVLSSSNLDSDIVRAKALGADDYFVKPNEHRELIALLTSLSAKWLTT